MVSDDERWSWGLQVLGVVSGEMQGMKRQKYCPSVIKTGATLYRATGYEWEGRIQITVDEWVVRSIRRRRGSQSQFGSRLPSLLREDQLYVNLAVRLERITWGKRSVRTGDVGWLKSIPKEFRSQFKVGDDLPVGMYTTQLAALKYCLVDTQSMVRWYEDKLQQGVPDDEKPDYEKELDEASRMVKAVKTRITRLRK